MKQVNFLRPYAALLLCLFLFMPPSAPASEVAIDFLWVNSYIKQGGTSRAYISVDPNPKDRVLVGVFENVAGGVGPQMTAAGWMAAVMAGQVLGLDLADYKISYDIFGRVDGPSAGGLTTAGVLAAILNDTVLADVTMTGTINPDGTIGPVGGIPQKLQGAAQTGKRTVLIPYGSRYGRNLQTDSMVDLVDFGANLGVKVLQVRDIYEAYQYLTGKALPRAQVKEDFIPALPQRVFDRTRDAVRAWHARGNEIEGKYKLIPDDYKSQDVSATMTTAKKIYEGSLDALRQGNVAVAYSRAVMAYVMGYMGYLQADVLRTLSTLSGDATAAVKTYIDAYRFSQERVNSFFSRLNTERIGTLSDMMTVADAYAKVVQAKGSILLAKSLEDSMQAIEKMMQDVAQQPANADSGKPVLGITVSQSPYGQGVVVNAVAPGSLAFHAGILVGDIILNVSGYAVNSVSDLGAVLGQTQVGSTLQFNLLRGAHQHLIHLAYVGSGQVVQQGPSQQQTEQHQALLEKWFQKMFLSVAFYKMSEISIDLAQDRLNIGLGFGNKDVPAAGAIKSLATLYSVAADATMRNFESLYVEREANRQGISLSRARMALMEEDLDYGLTYASYMGFVNYPPDSDVAQLGAAMELFYATSALVTKYYSLLAEVDKAGNVIKVGQEQALINMLDLAVRNARQNIILATEGGSVPVLAQLYYEVGKFSREGNLNDKLDALSSLWYAAAQSRAIAYLNGNLKIARAVQPAANDSTPQPTAPTPGTEQRQGQF